MTYDDIVLICVSFGLKMLGALVALSMIAACEYVGAKMHGIDLKKAIDKVEGDSHAFANYATGRFIGACIILAAIIG